MRILSPALFILGVMITLIHTEECPSPEKIYPCKCKEHDFEDDIIVTCDRAAKNLQQLKEALNSLLSKSDVELNLENLNLDRMPSNFLNGIGIRKLKIFLCKLHSLTDSHEQPALSGLENTLKELDIGVSSSEDNILPKLKLGRMRKLTKLRLFSNNITELGDDWFDSGPDSLKELNMVHNNISKIGEKAFANLNNLKYLFFDGNVYGGTLKRSMLPDPAYRLQFLFLKENGITEVPEDGFKGMPSLKYLYLSNNKIARLEQHHWQYIWQQLSIIKLDGNPLECDSHMDWIFKMRTTTSIYGKCAAPPERKGLSLFKFIHKKKP